MKKIIYSFYIAVTSLLFTSQSIASDFYDYPVNHLAESDFDTFVKRNFMLNEIEWIMPEDMQSIPQSQFEWVGEGEACYTTLPACAPLATTGLLTCTGVTAYTKDKNLALAHITDVTQPSMSLKFLREIQVDLEMPITLLSKTLNEDHFLEVKRYIETRYDEACPVLKTMPIIIYHEQVVTLFDSTTYNEIKKDFRGISFAFHTDGSHSFFYQDSYEQMLINSNLQTHRSPLIRSVRMI